ncbi:hypothetical protein KFE25_009868 [Diacronema lutheri]|uniref:DUF1995 domain-containing protein n=2 Tax=Diacronema lutheri TaxID=2081491 RepID=A0A8J5XS97_DIALT|nr:hypothetical protein KFE25_009868 [Diacronema lutheri]
MPPSAHLRVVLALCTAGAAAGAACAAPRARAGLSSVAARPRAAVRAASEPAAAPTAAATGSDELALPPASFEALLRQAQASTLASVGDGHRLLEVEFPPLPTAILEDASSSAYDVSDANVRLAVRYAQGLGKRVAVLVPDRPELERAIKVAGGRQQPYANVSLHSLTGSSPVLSGGGAQGADNSIEGFFSRIFNIERLGKANVTIVPEAEIYVILTVSCQELPDVERLWAQDVAPNGRKAIVLFNLKLDTQRGDLGLPAFPRKALQHRFLSRVKPAYYLRSRSYSLSLRRPPFLLPFSGALFRVYPGPFQCLLDTGNGRYRMVRQYDRRPALGEFKEDLRQALKVDPEDKGQASDVLTRGYKTKTWFEEDAEGLDESDAWRT